MFGTKCFAHHPANKGILRDFSEKQAHEIVQRVWVSRNQNSHRTEQLSFCRNDQTLTLPRKASESVNTPREQNVAIPTGLWGTCGGVRWPTAGSFRPPFRCFGSGEIWFSCPLTSPKSPPPPPPPKRRSAIFCSMVTKASNLQVLVLGNKRTQDLCLQVRKHFNR